MAGTLGEKEWQILLTRIHDDKCTPFLGAGACHGVLPLGAELAEDWAEKFGYPLDDRRDLTRVAQFLATEYDPLFPKEVISRQFAGMGPPNFLEVDEPHRVFAQLPLSIYMTTNYDNFMMESLVANRFRAPKREICRWNSVLEREESLFESGQFVPSVATPLVFHLHGHLGVKESIVITEDDYLKFLAAIASNGALLPPAIRSAIMRSTFLFIGYRLSDWNFRVLFQGLRRDRNYMSILVLKPPTSAGQSCEKAQKYLERYYAEMDLRIYWGTARGFVQELWRRWSELHN